MWLIEYLKIRSNYEATTNPSRYASYPCEYFISSEFELNVKIYGIRGRILRNARYEKTSPPLTGRGLNRAVYLPWKINKCRQGR